MTAEVAEEISKLYNVNLEMVMVKRYIDTLSWDEVAKSLDIKMRTVLKFHGKALPRMRRILLADGLVELAVEAKDSEDIKLWNAGQLPVALIHPASAGHGLNIQSGGHILIWYGLTWSLELYQQTNARLWRQGQTQTVTIHHIVTKNTVDEDVLAALASKDVTQEKLIAAVKARL